MDEYTIRLQALFLKKEHECGKLSQLTARITQENITYINGIRDEVAEICRSIDIPIEQTNLSENPRCIELYKYLSLNTNFNCLELLAQDNAHTHLVDICPLLSPYLFVEILWRLHYEEILAESLLYIPLDFAVEIVEIARSCADMLHFDRALKFFKSLITNSCKKLVLIKTNGTQSADFEKNIKSLIYSIEEMLSVLSTESFLHLEDLPNEQKYERKGIVIRTILDIAITCLEYRKSDFTVSPVLDKLYKVTFGHEEVKQCDKNEMDKIIDNIGKDMMGPLLKKIKEIDCHCYMEWVEFDDIENPSITLQKAVGLRCYKLMEYIQNDESLKENEHLLCCLQQISSKPDPESEAATKSLDELIAGANENVGFVKELFKRCKTWDESTLEQIRQLKITADKNSCMALLDYIVFLKSDPHKDSLLRKVYLYAIYLLLHLEITEFVKTIIAFILKYDASDILECSNTEISFKDFINRNPNLSTEKDLKQAFTFVLKNPKKYMTMFIKVFMGHTSFEDTKLPMQDFVHFAPFMTIKDGDDNYLALVILRDIVINDAAHIQPQVISMMMSVITESTCIEKHDLVNMFFTPYLQCNKYPQLLLATIVLQLKHLWRGINCAKVDWSNLYQGLLKKLSMARKDTTAHKTNNCLVISSIKEFFEINPCRFEMRQETKVAILGVVEPFLEPLDRCFFIEMGLNWSLSITQDNMICDYEKRFFLAKHRILNSNRMADKLKQDFSNFGLLAEDFIRHAVLHSNKKEYISDGMSIMKGGWKFFNWHNLRHSYTHFCRITIEACQLCLEYPDDFAISSFFVILEFFADFLQELQATRIMMLTEEYCSIFVKGLASLEGSISGTPFYHNYNVMINRLRSAMVSAGSDNFCTVLNNLCQIVKEFSQNCIARYQKYEFNKPFSASATRYRLAYHVVNATIMLTNGEIEDCMLKAHECLLK